MDILLLIRGIIFGVNVVVIVPSCMLHLVLDIQVGCPLRCSFCATGKGGFSRNLKRHEIVEQVCLNSLFTLEIPFCGRGL